MTSHSQPVFACDVGIVNPVVACGSPIHVSLRLPAIWDSSDITQGFKKALSDAGGNIAPANGTSTSGLTGCARPETKDISWAYLTGTATTLAPNDEGYSKRSIAFAGYYSPEAAANASYRLCSFSPLEPAFGTDCDCSEMNEDLN